MTKSTMSRRDLFKFGGVAAAGVAGASMLGACSPQQPTAAGTNTAYASTQTVTVDGKAVEFQMYALKDEKGNPTNYIKLRDLAQILSGTEAQFAVGYDNAAKAISVTTGEAYTPNGSEMQTPFSGDRSYTGGAKSVTVDGEAVELTAITLTDDAGGGYTYFKLRDLGKALGFNTGWTREHEAEVYGEQNKNRILVSPGQQYTANLVAKDRTALLVQLICKQFNLTVCPSSARNVARPLRAVATAMDIVEGRFGEKSGKYTFSWMLSIMENVNWFEDRTFLLGAVSSVFLNAFAAVMVEADKAGKITGYTNNLHRTLVQLSPQLVRAYGRVQYPLMSAQGSTNTILKEIGRGALKATDILKVVNP